MKNAFFALFFLIPIVFAYVMTGQTLPYFSFDLRHGFLGTKSFQTVSTPLFQWSFYIHISSSLLVWVIGISQLMPRLIRNRSFHRASGKIYLLFILLLAAPTGLGLSLFANGGLSAKIGFFLQSCVWWVVTLKAFVEIKNGNLRSHIRWMLRSLAITYAAFSLRTESFLMLNFFGTKPIETYLSVVWLSWVGNLLIMETLLLYKLDIFFLHLLPKKTR